jgi:hypothetical protein
MINSDAYVFGSRCIFWILIQIKLDLAFTYIYSITRFILKGRTREEEKEYKHKVNQDRILFPVHRDRFLFFNSIEI